MKTIKQLQEAYKQCKKASKDKRYGCPFLGSCECNKYECNFLAVLVWVLEKDLDA